MLPLVGIGELIDIDWLPLGQPTPIRTTMPEPRWLSGIESRKECRQIKRGVIGAIPLAKRKPVYNVSRIASNRGCPVIGIAASISCVGMEMITAWIRGYAADKA